MIWTPTMEPPKEPDMEVYYDGKTLTIKPFSDKVFEGLKELKAYVVTSHKEGLGFCYTISFDEVMWRGAFLKQACDVVNGTNLWSFFVVDDSNTPVYSTELCIDTIYNLDDDDVLSICRLLKRLDKHGKIKR